MNLQAWRANPLLLRHMARGALGFVLLIGGLLYASQLGLWTLAPLGAALVLFRGCPTCWLAGFVTAIQQGKSSGCTDGSCGKTETRGSTYH